MTKRLLMNLLLTVIWMALTGRFELLNFLFGFVLSFFILWLMSRSSEDTKYFERLPKIISFIFYFFKELIKANMQVAHDVITPKFFMKPGIIKYPLDAKTDMEITLLANLISLTPGTLSLDVSDDKKVLYLHAMYIYDKEEFIESIKDGLEKKLLSLLR
ncbi:MAG: Na+/H+ antiporter subunit E [Chitinophagaceae bacterium]|nr:Na+/H+ antiporter subunit E [Flavisolibacter sp.]